MEFLPLFSSYNALKYTYWRGVRVIRVHGTYNFPIKYCLEPYNLNTFRLLDKTVNNVVNLVFEFLQSYFPIKYYVNHKVSRK